ncbi:hypothetical protein EMIT0347P_20587 [Pseudomonas sp. IT-347P]
MIAWLLRPFFRMDSIKACISAITSSWAILGRESSLDAWSYSRYRSTAYNIATDPCVKPFYAHIRSIKSHIGVRHGSAEQ